MTRTGKLKGQEGSEHQFCAHKAYGRTQRDVPGRNGRSGDAIGRSWGATRRSRNATGPSGDATGPPGGAKHATGATRLDPKIRENCFRRGFRGGSRFAPHFRYTLKPKHSGFVGGQEFSGAFTCSILKDFRVLYTNKKKYRFGVRCGT